MWFNFEKSEDWLWSAFDMSFPDIWSKIEAYILNDQILIIDLCIRNGWFPIFKETDEKYLEKLGIRISSKFNLDEYGKCWLISKTEMGKLCNLQYPPDIHWIDCNVTPSEDSIRKIYSEYFKDDMFEEKLTHELANRFGSSITFFSTGSHETRIEYQTRTLGEELIFSELRKLKRSLDSMHGIEFTQQHVNYLINVALSNRGPIELNAKDIQVTKSGFIISFKGHKKKFYLETIGNKIELREQ